MAGPETVATDIVNQALDAIGADSISEMRDGSREANAALRHYGPTVRDLLRAAHWNFARKMALLSLAKDSTVSDDSIPRDVPPPWLYEYLYPQDCIKLRFIPWLGAQDDEDPPLMTSMVAGATISGMQPAPFVVGTDLMVPNESAPSNGLAVILTNVRNAFAVYTAAIFDPVLWDSLFMGGVAATLAAKLAMPCLDDKKMALSIRAEQIAVAKDIISQARVANGNESWTTADNLPDWIRIRGIGRYPYGFVASAGFGGCGGWDALNFPDGSAY